MNDPAIEAAQRATGGRVSHLVGPGRYALRGAREMADPIRELHRPDAGHSPECECGLAPGALPNCLGCSDDWPCATAKLVYSSEELER